MIEAEQFVECAREFGYRWYTGVPCSFLTPFIDYVIDSGSLHYLSSANEGDAVATAAGTVIAGQRGIAMMQNSGLGNAVSPLTSLTWVFRIPVLLIITWRGQPGLNDEPQHRLMGQITGRLLEAMEIPWEPFPTDAAQIPATLRRAQEHMQARQRPYALLMRKASVAPYRSGGSRSAGSSPGARAHRSSSATRAAKQRASRSEALQCIVERTPPRDTVLIATTGYTGRELYALADRPNQLYMVGSMGCAATLGLGLAMARPDLRVVVIDGDGAALMRMGSFATLGAYADQSLIHILLDNEVHDSTGAQATVSAGMSFAGVASACGYRIALEGDEPSLLEELFGTNVAGGPRFLQLKIRPGTPESLPRPKLTPVEVKERLMAHIGASP